MISIFEKINAEIRHHEPLLGKNDRARERRKRRRQALIAVALSYMLGFISLMIYVASGTIKLHLAVEFLLAGILNMAFFLTLSESGFNDRFKDHTLSYIQVFANVIILLCFVIAAPQIAYGFLCVIFLVISCGAVQLSVRESASVWLFMTAAVSLIFFFCGDKIGMATTTPLERFGAAVCFIATAAQCSAVSIHSSALRHLFYKRSLELREANQLITELADTDELTGAYNRRFIMRALQNEALLMQQTKSRCAIAAIDLDWFKTINDRFGHAAGDEVLRTFAMTIFANIKEADKLARFGGEEFVVIFPHQSDDEAYANMERLRKIIACVDWHTIASGLKLTISAGVTTLIDGEHPDTALSRADHALYEAKRLGRNRVERAEASRAIQRQVGPTLVPDETPPSLVGI